MSDSSQRACTGSPPVPLALNLPDYECERALFKAFSDPRRLEILHLLRSGELCACDILANMGISQPTLSHHMKILVQAGVVEARSSGRWTYYTTSYAGLQRALDLIAAFGTQGDNPPACSPGCGCR